MNISVHCLGATQSVTGSKHLLHFDDFQVLMDCRLLQGLKELRLRNWNPFPMDVSQVGPLREAPKRTFIVYGEPESAQALQQTLTQKLG